MEQNNEINIIIKTCKVCFKQQSDSVKFQKNKHTCIRCNSKKGNERLGNEYFRLKMIGRYQKNGGKVGRPKKESLEL